MTRTLRFLVLAITEDRRAKRQLHAVLQLCDRMDADPRNGGVVLTQSIRAAARRG